MSWTGRKRSSGDRYPSGKLRPHKPAKPADQPHRKGYGDNPLAETQHGRYRLDGVINQQQWLAGAFYGRTRLRYRAAVGTPDSLRWPSERHRGERVDRDAEYIAEYEGARTALGRYWVDVDWVIGQDAMLADLTAYRHGLDVLRRFYRV